MPPIKELHYFDRSPSYPSPSYLASPRLVERLFGKQKHNADFRRHFLRNLGSFAFHRRWSDLRWQCKHFLGHYDDNWYFSLFEEGKGLLKGEITPSYSILDVDDVRAIKKLLPDLKVLFFVRNPIDRAWSHVRFDWTRNWFQDIDSVDGIRRFIDSPKQRLRGDYLRTIDIWRSCYPEEQFFVGFYDDVLRDPDNLLVDIYQFLGIRDPAEEGIRAVKERKNVSEKMDIPIPILTYLAEEYRPEIEKLHERLGGHATAWLAEADQILQEQRPIRSQ